MNEKEFFGHFEPLFHSHCWPVRASVRVSSCWEDSLCRLHTVSGWHFIFALDHSRNPPMMTESKDRGCGLMDGVPCTLHFRFGGDAFNW